jgi:D-alanyl-lipoteichoic acid acyltransferase DltB (MBOAT superfamily)
MKRLGNYVFQFLGLSEMRLTAKLLLALTITVILGSEYHGAHVHILLSDAPGGLLTALSRELSSSYKFESHCSDNAASNNSSVATLVSLCICMCIPPTVARQRRSKLVSSAKESRRLVFPRTINTYYFIGFL